VLGYRKTLITDPSGKQNKTLPATYLWYEKTDNSFCICLDYRFLNKNLKKENFPMSNIDYIPSKVQKHCIFFKIDLRSAYSNTCLSGTAENLTSFISRKDTFAFRAMPFGLKNASNILQR
jgi:hypothetical protein